MKNTVTIRLTALDPLAVTDGSSEGMSHRTLRYIPGSMLLGAFAFLWKRLHPGADADADPDFVSLFLDGGASWGNATPEIGGRASVPIPLCWQKVKNHEGLPTVGGAKAADARVFNLIAADEATRLGEVLRREFPTDPEASDAVDALKLKKLGDGFMDAETFCRPNLHEIWTMHVSLAERRSADGLLFGYSAIAPGAFFQSRVICRDEEIAQKVAVLISSAEGHIIRIGRSRSAGYGRLRCECAVGESQAPATAKGQALIYFLSDYVPRHVWSSPLEDLAQELRATLGRPITLDPSRRHCAFNTVAGFNGLWCLPRRSRSVILRGSVARITFEGTIEAFPTALGALQQEGYGRILCSPAFLDDLLVRPKDMVLPTEENVAPGAISPLLSLVRRRTVDRRVQEDGITFVSLQNIDDFITDVAWHDKPSSSQLGNIRSLVTFTPPDTWCHSFTEMLGKTPGEQWKTVRARDPFYSSRKEMLDVIFLKFLGPAFDELRKELPKLRLLGSDPTASEEERYKTGLHRFALLELLSAWEKARLKKRRKD